MAEELIPLEDWLIKAGYEGGIWEGFEYGLKADDIQPNIDQHDEIALSHQVAESKDKERRDRRDV